MKFIMIVFGILFLSNCSKPKTVLICGDHECVNKVEAEQYFKENLSIEVRVVDTEDKNEIDLVELNMRENKDGVKKISILSKKNTERDLKILTNKEIAKIKKEISDKKKEKKIVKKVVKKKQNLLNKEEKIKQVKKKKFENNNIQTNNIIVDICSILDKCNIDEISKYLLEQGKKKKFPDITKRQ